MREQVIAEIDRNSTEKTLIALSTYRGKQLIDLRVHWLDDTGVWRATRKGVAFKEEDLPEVLEALQEASRLLEAEPVGAGNGH